MRPDRAETNTLAFQVREFEPRDQEAARALIIAGLGEHFGHVDGSLNPDLNDITATYAGSFLIVAERDGRIVGTGFLRPVDAATGEVVRMSVASEARRTGVGGAILASLLAHGRSRGYASVLLSTLVHWDDAVSFYRSAGFVEKRRAEVPLGTAVFFELKLKR